MALNINDTRFITDFDMKKMTVGQVGHGYIGQAVEALFHGFCEVLVYDKFKPGSIPLDDVVSRAQVIFVAVPTPMTKTGECHTGIVEDVLQDINNSAVKVGRDRSEFIVVMKSTIPPGFTTRMRKRHDKMRIMFSPEFLTEKNSVDDFKNSTRVLLGGSIEDAKVVYKFFEGVWTDRINVDSPKNVKIVHCEPEQAEIVKLFTNAILMMRVVFANEMYLLCEKLGVSYDVVRDLACLDPRINKSHLNVPGPDGHFGAGGHCFPKDVNNLKHIMHELGTGEKLISAILERNSELRDFKDWEMMEGRAVIK